MESQQYKTIIETNHYRMSYMADNKKNEYFEEFGKHLEAGLSIQEAINRCWEKFKPQEITKK